MCPKQDSQMNVYTKGEEGEEAGAGKEEDIDVGGAKEEVDDINDKLLKGAFRDG